MCGFACDSPAARRRPPQSTARPSARRAHTDRHTHTALDGDALSREIFLYVELDFVCPKKDAQGTVARLDLARICDRPGLHCGRARGSIADRSVRRSHRPGAHTHHARPLRSMRDISVRKRGKRMPCAHHIERDCIDLEQLHTALSANTCPAPSERGRNAALPERPRRARIPPTACSCDVPMVASVFVRIPVQGGEGCSMATRARTAHRSGNREASARTRCARMACRVQWRASVSWR